MNRSALPAILALAVLAWLAAAQPARGQTPATSERPQADPDAAEPADADDADDIDGDDDEDDDDDAGRPARPAPRNPLAEPDDADRGPSPPPTIQVSVEPAAPTVDEIIRLTYTVTGRIILYDEPSIVWGNLHPITTQRPMVDFDRAGQPVRRWVYFARPVTPGSATASGFQVTAKDESVVTAPEQRLTIRPVPELPPLSPREAQAALEAPPEGLSVQVAPAHATCYVGQALPVEVAVYAKGVEEAVVREMVATPEVREGRARVHSTKVDAAAARGQVVLVPQAPGRRVVGPAVVMVGSSGGGAADLRVVRSRAFFVDVLELPGGAPEGFAPENVGELALDARLEDAQGQPVEELVAGQPYRLQVVVQGKEPFGDVRVFARYERDQYEVVHESAPPPVAAGAGAIPSRPDMPHRATTSFTVRPLAVGALPGPKAVLVSFDPATGGYREVLAHGRRLAITGRPVPRSERRPMVSLRGGETLGPQDRHGIRMEVGWPGIRAVYVIPIAPNVDIGPKLSLLWGRNSRTGILGLEPGVELRAGLWSDGGLSLAAEAELAIQSRAKLDGTNGQYGVRLGVGLLMGWRALRVLAVDFGVRTGAGIYTGASDTFHVPLLGELGVEIQVASEERLRVNLAPFLRLGAELIFGSGRKDELAFEAGLGVTAAWGDPR